MDKIAVVTGITGQDGAFLSDFLLKKNYKVIGLAPTIQEDHLVRLKYFNIGKKVVLRKGSVADGGFIKQILKKYKPSEFYNLAGQSSVSKSWIHPEGTFVTNGVAVIAILEMIRLYSPSTRFFQCSSAEIYGNTSKIVDENLEVFDPVSPYGISKLAAHLAVKNFRQQYGIFAVNGILFNHESPLRAEGMVAKKIANGVAKISLGTQKKLVLGDINVLRDWGYAGDFVEAMWLMLQQLTPKDFVICSGISLPITKFLAEAFSYVGISNWQKYVVLDRDLLRKMEIKKMKGSANLITKELGWEHKINLKGLVKLMIDYELELIKNKSF